MVSPGCLLLSSSSSSTVIRSSHSQFANHNYKRTIWQLTGNTRRDVILAESTTLRGSESSFVRRQYEVAKLLQNHMIWFDMFDLQYHAGIVRRIITTFNPRDVAFGVSFHLTSFIHCRTL